MSGEPASNLQVLEERLDAIREMLSDLKTRMIRLEERSERACRECAVWEKVHNMGKQLISLELRVERAIGIAIGVSALVGLVWSIISFVISHT